MPDRDTVFVVHGRDAAARKAIFEFLRSLSLKPLEWNQAVAATANPVPSISQILDAAFERAQAVVVLLTGDDEVRLRGTFASPDDPAYERELTPQARPNVLFEAGLAMGRSPDRVVIVELGAVKPFSDIAGRHTVRMDGSTQRRQELADKLTHAKCIVDRTGTDWHTAGDFAAALLHAAEKHEVPAPPSATPVVSLPISAPTSGLSTNVELAEPSLISAVNFTCKLIKRDSPFWRFGWQMSITNRSRGESRYRFELRFIDENGHTVDTDVDRPEMALQPLETKPFSGQARVAADLAPSVQRVTALVSRV